ncbi:MAG: tryptophan synthase subunit alpha [Trueperaceae bacterium]|nr:tryptophan synthase subunit alpha [Trueperaceae bacterium]
MSRIASAFAAAAAENRAALVCYLMSGYPTPERYLQDAQKLLETCDLLEVGIPFSDPLGDGPTVQRAGERVLADGMTTERAFRLLRDLRARTDKPLVAMTYYNPIFCYPGGPAAFAAALKAAGGDGVILPDLPPDEGEEFIEAAREVGLDTVFLIAPTSTDERLKLVTSACRGFVYAVSVTGVTGARSSVGADVAGMVARAKAVTGLPIAVGFGVSSRETAAAIGAYADGVVVGSALLSAQERGADLGEFVGELAAGCRRG